jgi:rfaE bifunctional protein nucleotidyltransferase chain/domain
MSKLRKNSHELVLELEELGTITAKIKSQGCVVGVCHGCFDVLHAGHLKHFEAASKLCDLLIVTVTPDQFINKGSNRPVFPAQQRAELISGMACVDYVGINKWPSAVEMIGLIKPTILIKGQEYETKAEVVNPNFLKEKVAIEEIGGAVAFTYEWVSSSSAAIERMRS